MSQEISLECGNCSSSTKLTLSVKCDGSMVVGEIPGEQTLWVPGASDVRIKSATRCTI